MIALRTCLVTMLLTAIYIVISVQCCSIFFNYQSNGSILKDGNKIIGSKLIGQSFTDMKHFHNRPSISNYKNDVSGNSNLPYHSNELKTFIALKSNEYLKTNESKSPDLNSITESASGLDPHITLKNALTQSNRISKNTSLSKNEISDLIHKHTKKYGISREPILNVLELNIELERLYAKKTRA